MKKTSIPLLFWISFIQISIGQITTATSYDGYSYSVGDTIQIGYPRYSSQTYDFIRYAEGNENATYYNKLKKEEFPLTYGVIEKITPTEQNEVFSFAEKSPLLEVRSLHKPDNRLFVNLDYAIAQKELARNLKHRQPNEKPIETHTLLTFHHKIYKEEITDNALLQYINSKDTELGKACNENKFTFQKIKAEWKTTFEKEMANLAFEKVYILEMPVKHSKYDFEKSGYRISFAPDFYDKDKNIVKLLPYYFRFQNFTKKNFLPLSPVIAEKFETTQKGISYYSWFGTLYARIFFKFSEKPVEYQKSDKGIALHIIYGNNLMDVEIQKVEVFDHESYQYNYVGTIH